MGHFLKLKFAHSPLNLTHFFFKKCPIYCTLTTVQVPNLALVETKRITVLPLNFYLWAGRSFAYNVWVGGNHSSCSKKEFLFTYSCSIKDLLHLSVQTFFFIKQMQPFIRRRGRVLQFMYFSKGNKLDLVLNDR